MARLRRRGSNLSPEEERAKQERYHAFVKIKEQEIKKKEEAEFLPTRERVATCKCGGGIVIETTYHFEPDSPRSMFVSLRKLGRFARTECFCESCGGLYKLEVVKK